MKGKQFRRLFGLFLLLILYIFLSREAVALEVKKTILPDGLIVLHSEEHSLPLVMVTLLVKAGQLNEPSDKAGLVNLVAETLTEGTKTRKAVDISEEIEFIGALLDVSADRDYTTITLSVLKKDVVKGFEIFSDVLRNSVFPKEELERKKKLIKGILRQKEEDPSFLAERAFIKTLFGDHPYGRPVEGFVKTIDNIERDDLLEFYSRYFLPNNSILAVVGDLNADELNALIKKHLDSWKESDLQPRTFAEQDEKRSSKVIKIDRDLKQANIILGHIGIKRDNPDYYAISVMNYILGSGGFSSRLVHAVREEMGLAYDVYSLFISNKDKGIFQVEVQTKNESANVVISQILKQIEKMRKEYVSDEELSEAKSYLTGSLPRRLDTNRKIADFLAYTEFYSLGLDYLDKYLGYINSVTKEDILRVAKKYLDPENYVLVVVADQKKASLKY